MSDRELLELAAKAAGMKVRFIDDGLITYPGFDFTCIDESHFEWNPLADDGHALRLAVKIGLYFGVLEHSVLVSNFEGLLIQLPFYENKYATTRRAIVSAAAEIGKGMKS